MSTWQEFAALTEREQIERVLAVMADVVQEYGAAYDYAAKHDTCVYVRDGAPSCLVGHVAYRLGLPLERMAGDSPTAFDSINGCAIDSRGNHPWSTGPLRLSWAAELAPGTVAVLRAAQNVQDGATDDSTWGAALVAARHAATPYNVTVH